MPKRTDFQVFTSGKFNVHSILGFAFSCFTTLILLMLLIFASNVSARPISIVFVPLGSHENEFWGRVIDFAEAVAKDLDIELEIAITERAASSAIHFRRIIYGILKRNNKPDYILIPYWVGASDVDFLSACRLQQVKVFIFNTHIPADHQEKTGVPREKFKNWIGHMYPDDTKAGYELAKILAQQAVSSKSNTELPHRFSALKGLVDTHISDIRYDGLEQFLSESEHTLEKSFNTTWRRNSASMATENILKEYPDTSIIWTVGDELALGAIDTLKSLNRKPGEDVFVGGFDGQKSALNAIKAGEMTATMGGHFVEGGWSLVMIYDYHHGHDFIDDPGVTYITPLRLINAENVDKYGKLTGDQDWEKIDFKQYSKTYNPDLKKYDFSLETLYWNLIEAD